MNIPINCPICGDPLVNTFNDTTDKVFYKNCRLRPDHIFSCAIYLKGFMDSNIDLVDRVAFTLLMSPMLSIIAYIQDKIMKISKYAPHDKAVASNSEELPFYVEPDFSDYKALVNKIKTYILFS
jgi:hypothetical protein